MQSFIAAPAVVKYIKIHQNASKCIKIHQNTSKYIKGQRKQRVKNLFCIVFIYIQAAVVSEAHAANPKQTGPQPRSKIPSPSDPATFAASLCRWQNAPTPLRCCPGTAVVTVVCSEIWRHFAMPGSAPRRPRSSPGNCSNQPAQLPQPAKHQCAALRHHGTGWIWMALAYKFIQIYTNHIKLLYKSGHQFAACALPISKVLYAWKDLKLRAHL